MHGLWAMTSDGPGCASASSMRGDGLVAARLHRDAGDVHVPVGHREQAQVLLRGRLAGGGELGHRADRRRLGLLAAGVGVALGVEHQHVDVAVGGQHVVQPTEADVVGPAVAADDPDRTWDEAARRARPTPPRPGPSEPSSSARSSATVERRCRDRTGVERSGTVRRAATRPSGSVGASCSSRARACPSCASRPEAHAEAELGVVLEQGVAPRRTPSVGVGRVRAWSGRLPP